MSASGRYVWKDMGWQALRNKVSRLSGVTANVGLVGSSGAAVHQGSNDDLTNAEVGACMEFGVPGVPPRPFMAPTMHENRMAYLNMCKSALRRFIYTGAQADDIMSQLGQWLANKMKEKVLSNVPPPLAEATVEKKGHADSLIDTGQLYDAITYELVHGAVEEFLESTPQYDPNENIISQQMRGFWGK